MKESRAMFSKQLSRRALMVLSGGLALGACQRKLPVERALMKRPSGTMYEVKRGDTLHHIADVCRLDISEIKFYNDIEGTHLRVGQKLFLPYQTYIPPALKRSRAPLQPLIEARPLKLEVTDLDINTDVRVLGRHTWGAKPTRSNSSPMGIVDRITLHHTSVYPGMGRSDINDVEVIRSIANYHVNHKGWADIGYHYLIGRDGRVYEGRPVAKQGAHTGGNNERNLGISVVGDFMKALPNDRQMDALKSFLGDQMSRYGVRRDRLYGHRDLGNTLCPGTKLYRWLQGYRLGLS